MISVPVTAIGGSLLWRGRHDSVRFGVRSCPLRPDDALPWSSARLILMCKRLPRCSAGGMWRRRPGSLERRRRGRLEWLDVVHELLHSSTAGVHAWASKPPTPLLACFRLERKPRMHDRVSERPDTVCKCKYMRVIACGTAEAPATLRGYKEGGTCTAASAAQVAGGLHL